MNEDASEHVRCVDCRGEYELPAAGELACPDCGSTSWISARIPVEPVKPHPVPR